MKRKSKDQQQGPGVVKGTDGGESLLFENNQ
jgi:hypothetical protein